MKDDEIRILILEDNLPDAKWVELELRKGGIVFQSKWVETRDDFISQVEEFTPQVILADYRLPAFTGMEAFAIIKEKGLEVPFIIVSGVLGEDLAIETLKAGVTDYVLKSNFNRLVPAVNRALAETKLQNERRQAEEALRESEKRFKAIADYTYTWENWIGNDGRLLWVNPAVERITGYSTQEVMSMGDFPAPLIVEEDRARTLREFRNAVQKRTSGGNLEVRFQRKDGQIIWGAVAWQQIFDEKGESIGHRSSIRDITARKLADEALIQERDRAKQLLDIACVMILALDTEGRVTLINVKGSEILGCRPEEIIGMVWADTFLPERIRAELKASFGRLVSGDVEPVEYFENPVLTSQGTERIIAWHNSVIRDDKGEITGTLSSGEDITERKRSEETLRKSEERFRQMFDNMSNCVAVYEAIEDGEDFIIKDFNRAAEKTEGVTRENVLGRSVVKVFPAVKEIGLFEVFQRVWKTGKPEFHPASLYKDNRISGWKENFVYKLSSDEVVAIYEDVTTRKQAEEALRESEFHLARAQQIAHLGSWSWDIAADRLYWSDETYRLFGLQPGEFVPRNEDFLSLVHPEDRKRIEKAVQDALVYGYYNPEFRIIQKGGEERYVYSKGDIIFDQEGNPVKMEGTVQDITERKRAEEAVRESEAKYRELVENAKSVILRFDVTGKVIFINEYGETLFGYKQEELIGRNAVGRIVPEKDEAGKDLEAMIKEICEDTEKYRKNENENMTRDGRKLWINWTNTAIYDQQGKVIEILSVGNDITERKQAEEQMLSLQAQLQQSQKMEGLGQLAGGVAHDFNNLLTVISIQSQLGLRGLREGDPLKEKLKDIELAADRAASLTRQLLAFSRRQILEMKVINLNFILKDMEKMLRRVIGEDIELKTVLSDDLGMVKVDPGQMEQVIVNLAVNAKDAMPRGGKLFLETANAKLDEKDVRSHVGMIPGAYIILSITDTGIGMSKEVKEQIFDPFFTTKEKGKGTGLGLSTVYGIVKQSGGDIDVYSKPGKGTTFKIYFPRVFEPQEEFKKEAKEELPRGTETILVVEDDGMVRRLAVDILRRQGYRVLEAEAGGEGLLISEQYKEPIDLILTDVVMPHMGGPELIERLRQVRKDFKMLYMTGYTDEAIVQHGILEEGVNLINKPFTVEKLARKIREVLDGKKTTGK